MPALDDNVCPCCAVPDTAGATVHCGAPTTGVAADATYPEPAAFVPVTSVRNVDPTSAEPTTYDDPVEPVYAQLPPFASHRHHSYL